MIRKYGVILAALVALYIGYLQWQKHNTVPPFKGFDTPLTDLEEKAVDIRSANSDYYLVSYFQTWCTDCVRELPSIVELGEKVPEGKLAIYMISDEPKDKINVFKVRFNAPLNFYQSAVSFKEMSVRVFPTTYLVDKNGRILLSKLEGYNWASEDVLGIIQR